MIVEQRNYFWMVVFLIGVVVLAIAFGLTLADTDLLRWNTTGAAADATRGASADLALQRAMDRSLTETAAAREQSWRETQQPAWETQTALQVANQGVLMHATETAVALSAKRDQEIARAAATHTAEAVALDRALAQERAYSDLDLTRFIVYLAGGLVATVVIAACIVGIIRTLRLTQVANVAEHRLGRVSRETVSGRLIDNSVNRARQPTAPQLEPPEPTVAHRHGYPQD